MDSEEHDEHVEAVAGEATVEAVDVDGVTASTQGEAEFREATARDPALRRLSLYLQKKELKIDDLTDSGARELKFYSSLGGLFSASS